MSQFIKEIFLPEKIKTSYLFAKTVVGIEINKTNIIATKTRLKGTSSTIELTIEEKIAENISEDNDPTSTALASIFAKIDKYDEIHTVLPSSIVIFKELKLPFLDQEKISMVIGFEIEPLLPFSLRDGIIDFIITRQIPEEKSSEIMVTAVQKQHIIEHLTLFEAVGLKPTVITIDMISVYALYKHIPAYNQLDGGAVLIDINPYTTIITLIINGQLKIVRTLPKGIITIAKTAAQELQKTPHEILEHLLRFGLEATELANYTASVQKAITAWWDSINFTLTSFSTQLLNRKPLTKIILLGEGSLIKGIIPFIATKTGVACEQFNTHFLNEDKSLIIKNNSVITPINLISVSATLPLSITSNYNLGKKEFSSPDNSLLIKQLIVLILLTIILFTTLIINYSIQTKRLKKEIKASEYTALTALKSTFTDLEETDLDDVINEAQEELKLQKETWFAFSGSSRMSFLECLLELTIKIDKKSLGFNLDQITIAEGILTLKAQVRDHDALTILIRELSQSKLFKEVEPVENTPFVMRIKLATKSEEL